MPSDVDAVHVCASPEIAVSQLYLDVLVQKRNTSSKPGPRSTGAVAMANEHWGTRGGANLRVVGPTNPHADTEP